MNLVQNKQLPLNVPFQSTKIERKNCEGTTKYKKLLEMCIVQHVEMKIVFTYQAIKRLVSPTLKSAKLAATFWMLLLTTKNQQLCCVAVTVYSVLQERRIATTKKKNHGHFWRVFSANHNQAHPNLKQKRQKLFHLWNNCVDTPLVYTVNQKLNFIIIL